MQLKNISTTKWLNSILMSIHDGVLVIDSRGIVQFVNSEYSNITGVPYKEIINKPLKEVRPNAQLVDVLSSGREKVGIYRKEKETEYVVDMAPIFFNDKIIGAVSICKGLTEIHKLVNTLKDERDSLKWKLGSVHEAKYTFDHILGNSNQLKKVINIAKKVADTDLPILISGESGTGKELFAQSIHNNSSRMLRPFIPINCATIPTSLIESELFGYEGGSFTNARKEGKVGLFELANGGTIFLDEIGELPLNVQAKFLRVLEEQTIRRVGGDKEIPINVRVIAATNRNLEYLIEKDMFREDLFYRLNVLRLEIPPLRKRTEDIPLIAHSILTKMSNGLNTVYSISNEVLETFLYYEWPGNVRELMNTMKYAICMTDSNEISLKDLPENFNRNKDMNNKVGEISLQEALDETEKQYIESIVKRYKDRKHGKQIIANKLNISLATLYNKLNKHHIKF